MTQLFTYIYSFHILFHYGLLKDIEYSSLCYTVGPCCLFTLFITQLWRRKIEKYKPFKLFLPPSINFLTYTQHRFNVCVTHTETHTHKENGIF